MDRKASLRMLPSVERVLEDERIASRINVVSRRGITRIVRDTIDRFRKGIVAGSVETGDVEAALRSAEIVVSGEYRTGAQEHIYIEPQGMIAWFETDDTLHVLGSMQCPYYVSGALAHVLQVPPEKVRVKPAAVGGAFGGKEDFPSLIALHAALLARVAGRPVKIVYDRHEDIVATTKRHPGLVRHRTAVDAEGRLTAMDIEVLLDGGAYRTLSPVVLSRSVLHAAGAYRCPNVRVRGRVLRTHTPPNGAFRGFGAPQSLFAVERQMDRIARVVGLDPLERNFTFKKFNSD